MYTQFKQILFISAIALTAASCDKKEDPVVPTTPTPTGPAEMHIMFKNYVGTSEMELDNATYTNQKGETYKISLFNYYISNIKFTKKDGTEYAEPESYHLIQQSSSTSGHFHIEDVPAGEYKSVTFTVGVDEARNTSGAQTGALDPVNGMFWTWNTGYIMAKLEGTSDASTATDKVFRHHIGGFKGEMSGVRTITLDFPATIAVGDKAAGDIVIKTDAAKWFGPDNVISIAEASDIMMPSATSVKIANNYSKMFSITSATTVIE